MRTFAMIVVGTALFLAPCAARQMEAQTSNAAGAISATGVANAFWPEVLAHPDSQVAILERHVPYLVVDTLRPPASRTERLSLGEAMFLSFRAAEADFYFRTVLEGDDLVARHASIRLMQIRFRAFDDSAGMRSLYDRHYRTFPPSVLDVFGRYQQTVNLATTYRDAGEDAAAIDLIMQEIASLPNDAPYQSYATPMLFDDLVSRAPGGEQVVRLIGIRLPALRATLERWREEEPTATSDPQLSTIVPTWYWRWQGVRPGETFREARMRQLASMIGRLEAWLVSHDEASNA